MPDSPTRPRPRDQDRSLTGIPHAPTRYVQLLTPRRARAYLTNATEGGFCRAYAQGFFLPADALPRRPTASAILQLMDLGWLCESGTLASFTGPPPNAQGLPPATDTTGNEECSSCVYLLHFDVLPDIEATLTRQDPPGAAPASAPWWHSSEPMTLLPGARIEAVDEEGNSRVLAHWNAETNGLWHWGGLGNPGDFSTLATIFERTFARGHGWVPVRPIDRRRALADATDRRVLRCMLGSALSQSGVTVNAWGVVDLATTDTLVCTTHVLHWGLTGVVTSLHPDANGETMAAMSVHAPWSPAIEEAGMWGDEIGGFHADIPASETGPYAHESMIAPARPTPGPLEELRLPWGGTRQEHWHKDFIELPSGTRVPVVITAQGRVHAEAPDPRAVDILFPGPASFVPGPGPHVWVDVTDQGGVLLEATTTGQLFGSARLSARIVGESEDKWHYHTPSLLRRVDPTSRPPHWGAKRLITEIRERLTPRQGETNAP